MREYQPLKVAVAALLLVVMAGCSSMQGARHQYLMRGQVLEASAEQVLVCVGSRDGARAGQELKVYRFKANPARWDKSPSPRYERIEVGTVRISEVIDEHFATARVTGGSPTVNDVVELER